ncbi:hypothetical protein VNO77_04316 [Canavalia gladiata]|uniref:Uncharacterized protein n=1 Tax=Canavalia gladiata TaxID=3824 RepID=A0AAN9R4P9_CANGL
MCNMACDTPHSILAVLTIFSSFILISMDQCCVQFMFISSYNHLYDPLHSSHVQNDPTILNFKQWKHGSFGRLKSCWGPKSEWGLEVKEEEKD